jgi:hypothetical protein
MIIKFRSMPEWIKLNIFLIESIHFLFPNRPQVYGWTEDVHPLLRLPTRNNISYLFLHVSVNYTLSASVSGGRLVIAEFRKKLRNEWEAKKRNWMTPARDWSKIKKKTTSTVFNFFFWKGSTRDNGRWQNCQPAKSRVNKRRRVSIYRRV